MDLRRRSLRLGERVECLVPIDLVVLPFPHGDRSFDFSIILDDRVSLFQIIYRWLLVLP